MNDKVIEEILAAAGAMADRMQSLFENINDAFEQVGDILGIWANEHLHPVFEFAELDYESLYQDEPIPGVEPVDYVLRVGARSGYYIYSDEAWRYRANLDWWNKWRR